MRNANASAAVTKSPNMNFSMSTCDLSDQLALNSNLECYNSECNHAGSPNSKTDRPDSVMSLALSLSECSLKASLSSSSLRMPHSFSDPSLTGPLRPATGKSCSFSYSPEQKVTSEFHSDHSFLESFTSLPRPNACDGCISYIKPTTYRGRAQLFDPKSNSPLQRLAGGFARGLKKGTNPATQMTRLLKEYIVNDNNVVCNKEGNDIFHSSSRGEDAVIAIKHLQVEKVTILEDEYTARRGWNFNFKIDCAGKQSHNLPPLNNGRALTISDAVTADGNIFHRLVKSLWKVDAQATPSFIATAKATVLLFTMYSTPANYTMSRPGSQLDSSGTTTTFVSIACRIGTFVDKDKGLLLASRQSLFPIHDPSTPIVVCMLSKESECMEMHVAETLQVDDALNMMLLRIPKLAIPSIAGSLHLPRCGEGTTTPDDRVLVTTFVKRKGDTHPTFVELESSLDSSGAITAELTLHMTSCCEGLSGGLVSDKKGCVVGMLTTKTAAHPGVLHACNFTTGAASDWLDRVLPGRINKNGFAHTSVSYAVSSRGDNFVVGKSLRSIPSLDNLLHLAHYVERRQAQADLLRALGTGIHVLESGRKDVAHAQMVSVPARECINSKNPVVISNLGLQGGVGKTVLAKWVMKQPDIIDHYPLRLWVQLSHDPDLLQCLHELFIEITRGRCELKVYPEIKRDEQVQRTKTQVHNIVRYEYHVL